MHIEPLSYQTLDAAIKLVNQVFPYQIYQIFPLHALWEKARFSFPLSLRKNSIVTKIIFSLVGVAEVRYWLAVDQVSSKVIGTTGLYSFKKDKNEVDWLDWTCVAPEFRGQGIGGKLVDFAIEKARSEGKKFLRLYTSNYPNQATAQILYTKRGFRMTGEDKIKGTEFKILYLELELHGTNKDK